MNMLYIDVHVTQWFMDNIIHCDDAYSYLSEYESTNQHSNADVLSWLPVPSWAVPISNIPSCFNIEKVEVLLVATEVV